MKYKILVSGNNNIVVDYLKHTDSYFKNLSTTTYFKDIMRHFTLFEPDVFLIFIDDANTADINLIDKIKRHYSYNDAQIIILSTDAICTDIQKTQPFVADLLVKRPISPDNLSLRIIKHLESVFAEDTEEEIKTESTEAVQETAGETAAETVEAKKHILVVDDDRTVLKMVKTALEDTYEVTTMVNGVLVEKFIETKKIDLIILDYEMPVQTGAEVFRNLKNHPIGKNIPVCFLTGIAERSKIEEIMTLRPHGYLLKPISMEMFLSTVHNLVS